MKAFFFDIDGTFVPLVSKHVLPSTAEAIRQLRAGGDLCFIATGRSRTEMEEMDLLEGIQVDGILANNGQYGYRGEEELYSHPLDPEDVRAVVEQALELGYSAWFTEADRMYMNAPSEQALCALEAIHTDAPPQQDIRRAMDHPVYKIVLFLSPEEIQKYPLAVTKHCKAASWHAFGGDLIPESGGKDGAVRHILERFGIAREDTMAFGDGENDMDMLRSCAIGVAMGNGTGAVKAIADYVTDTDEQDGIYKALVHFGCIKDTLGLCGG